MQNNLIKAEEKKHFLVDRKVCLHARSMPLNIMQVPVRVYLGHVLVMINLVVKHKRLCLLGFAKPLNIGLNIIRMFVYIRNHSLGTQKC